MAATPSSNPLSPSSSFSFSFSISLGLTRSSIFAGSFAAGLSGCGAVRAPVDGAAGRPRPEAALEVAPSPPFSLRFCAAVIGLFNALLPTAAFRATRAARVPSSMPEVVVHRLLATSSSVPAHPSDLSSCRRSGPPRAEDRRLKTLTQASTASSGSVFRAGYLPLVKGLFSSARALALIPLAAPPAVSQWAPKSLHASNISRLTPLSEWEKKYVACVPVIRLKSLNTGVSLHFWTNKFTYILQ